MTEPDPPTRDDAPPALRAEARQEIGTLATLPGTGALVWPSPPAAQAEALDRAMVGLWEKLDAWVTVAARRMPDHFLVEAEQHTKELRGELLRHSRALSSELRKAADAPGRAAVLSRARATLSERARALVQARGEHVRHAPWSPDELLRGIDELVDTLPEQVQCPWQEVSFTRRSDADPLARRVRRALLRARRSWRGEDETDLPPRRVPVRAMGRFHLGGARARLADGVARLGAADRELAARTHAVLDSILRSYASMAASADDAPPSASQEELRRLRALAEQELVAAEEELRRATQHCVHLTGSKVAASLGALADELPVVATFDLPAELRAGPEAERRIASARRTLDTELDRTRRAGAGLWSLVALDLELVALDARMEQALLAPVAALSRELANEASEAIGRTAPVLDEMLAAIEAAIAAGEPADATLVRLRSVTDRHAERIVDAAGQAGAMCERLASGVALVPLRAAFDEAVSSLTETYQVASGRLGHTDWRTPPDGATIGVPLRELAMTVVEGPVDAALARIGRDLAARIGSGVSALRELERLFAFNLEVASGELEPLGSDVVPEATRDALRAMLVGALERKRGALATVLEGTAVPHAELAERARNDLLRPLEGLRVQLVERQMSRTHVEVLRRAAAGRLVWLEAGRLREGLSDLRDQTERAVTKLFGDDELDAWRRRIGWPGRPTDPRAMGEALAVPRARADLPLVYRRLFAAQALEAGEMLVARRNDVARAQRALAEDRRLRTVAVVGPPGVGKSTLAAAILRAGEWREVRRLRPSKPIGTTDVLAEVARVGNGGVLVVEAPQWMVAMRPGGFAPLRAFVDRVIADHGAHGFLLVADSPFWQYASRVAPLEEAFAEVVTLAPLDPGELAAEIGARHALSGYGLEFVTEPATGELERVVLSTIGRLRSPSEAYFRALHGASGGLLRDALRSWLASVERIDEERDVVRIGGLPRSALSTLRELPDDVLLGLQAMARQGWTDVDVHASVFRLGRSAADAQLGRWVHLGLVERQGSTFQIPAHLRGAVLRALVERGWSST
ncbi:MAG: ATP-binding protein [Deltaproteobacteria bacterium]|nr:ATP-binding protein [Deltaproteobacteria bacterium]